jgi:hypothetical protein
MPYALKQQLALKNTSVKDFELMRNLSSGNKERRSKKTTFAKLSDNPKSIDFIGLA